MAAHATETTRAEESTDREIDIGPKCSSAFCHAYDRSGQNATRHDRATGLCPACFAEKALDALAPLIADLDGVDDAKHALLDELFSAIEEDLPGLLAKRWHRNAVAAKRAVAEAGADGAAWRACPTCGDVHDPALRHSVCAVGHLDFVDDCVSCDVAAGYAKAVSR